MGKKSKSKQKNAKKQATPNDAAGVHPAVSYSVSEQRPVRATDICAIHGLKGAPQYNGSRGLVLGDSVADDGGHLRFPVRLFGHGGKELSAKVGNLRLSRDENDWIIPHTQKSLYEEITTHPFLGAIDHCRNFVTNLWATMGEKPPGRPLQIDHGWLWRRKIKGDDGHTVWWLAMDAISHHMILESRNGKYRVFQAYIKCFRNFGYSAKEWCSKDFRQKDAWRKFGGGKILTSSELDDLLDIILRYQTIVARVLRDVLLPAVPGLDPRAIPYLTRDGPEETDGTIDKRSVEKELKRVVVWADCMIQRLGPEGLTDAFMTEERRIMDGIQTIPVMIGTVVNGQHLFDVPVHLYDQLDKINRELTGEPFNSATLLFMLNSGVWWQSRRDPDDGSAMGFSILGMDVGRAESEEEGLRRVRKLRENLKGELR